jgi:hypothetical protein
VQLELDAHCATAIILVGLVLALPASAASQTPPPFTTAAPPSQLAEIDALIATHGKRPIIDLIRAKRFGRITVSTGTQLRDSLGPPNPQNVNAQSIAQDLARIPMDLPTLRRELNALPSQTPAATTPVVITMNDVSSAAGGRGGGGSTQGEEGKGYVDYKLTCSYAEAESRGHAEFVQRFRSINPGMPLTGVVTKVELDTGGGKMVSVTARTSGGVAVYGGISWSCETETKCSVTVRVPKVERK